MFEGEDIVKYKDLLDTAPDLYCFGHWHKDQGVVEMGGKQFLNIGSLTRGALSQDEVQRQPSCAILNFSEEGLVCQTVRLKVEPAEVVFDVERREHQERQQIEMDSFVSSVRESLAPQEGEVSLVDTLGDLEDISNTVRERALHYLEQASG